MLKEDEKKALLEEIMSLSRDNDIEAVASIVKEKWLIFSHLPEELRDNNQVALSAVTANMQSWHYLSTRLINDIDFFLKSFNSTNRFPIDLENPRDMLVMTQYANAHCTFGYTIPAHNVIEKYNYKRNLDAEKELCAANELIKIIKSWEIWFKGDVVNDEVACISYLYKKIPGFKVFTYIYAYKWAFNLSAQKMRSNYV